MQIWSIVGSKQLWQTCILTLSDTFYNSAQATHADAVYIISENKTLFCISEDNVKILRYCTVGYHDLDLPGSDDKPNQEEEHIECRE